MPPDPLGLRPPLTVVYLGVQPHQYYWAGYATGSTYDRVKNNSTTTVEGRLGYTSQTGSYLRFVHGVRDSRDLHGYLSYYVAYVFL